MAQSPDCSICCEKYNKSTNKLVVCNFCNYECCRSCVQTYLLNTLSEPHCMNDKCKHAWTYEFLSQNTPISFHNKKYRDYRAKVDMDREKSMFPNTMGRVNEIIQQRENAKQIAVLEKEVQILKDKIHKLRYPNSKPKERETKFVRGCFSEDCRGFLSTQWKCAVCSKNYCKQCFQEKEEEHKCNEEDVKTAEVLKENTKSCPKCGEGIFKVDGCDMMYCTACHTPFSWRTNQIVTGIIHNPHYYEYQRQRNNGNIPRVQGDIRCGGLPDMHAIIQKFANKRVNSEHFKLVERRDRWNPNHRYTGIPSDKDNKYVMAHRMIGHIQAIIRNKFQVENVNNMNEDLRVKYIMKEIDDAYFKKEVKRRNKKNQKIQEINQILTSYCSIMTDLFNNLYEDVEHYQTYIDEMEELRKFTNLALYKVELRYKNVMYYIRKSFYYDTTKTYYYGTQQRNEEFDMCTDYKETL